MNFEEQNMNRTGEQESIPERASRYFQQEEYWYYHTREGVDIGPFDSLSEAETGVSDFIDFVLHAEPSISETLAKYARVAA
jgi:hypothetical protein